MRIKLKHSMIAAALAVALTAGSAAAQGKGHDKDKDKGKHDREDDRGSIVQRESRGNVGLPPGLAKKPGGMPPGQYKKLYPSQGVVAMRDVFGRRGYTVVRTAPYGSSQYVYYRGRDGVTHRAVVSPGTERLTFSNVPPSLLQEIMARLY